MQFLSLLLKQSVPGNTQAWATVHRCLEFTNQPINKIRWFAQSFSNLEQMNQEITTENLLEQGPLIEAELFPDEESFLKLKNFGTAEPHARVKLLVDTGSNISGIDRSVIHVLSLVPYQQHVEEWVRGEAGSWQVKRYNCVLYLPIFKTKALTVEVLEGDFSSAPYDGIIGRDVLRFCDFRYDGQRNVFTLSAKGF